MKNTIIDITNKWLSRWVLAWVWLGILSQLPTLLRHKFTSKIVHFSALYSTWVFTMIRNIQRSCKNRTYILFGLTYIRYSDHARTERIFSLAWLTSDTEIMQEPNVSLVWPDLHPLQWSCKNRTYLLFGLTYIWYRDHARTKRIFSLAWLTSVTVIMQEPNVSLVWPDLHPLQWSCKNRTYL